MRGTLHRLSLPKQSPPLFVCGGGPDVSTENLRGCESECHVLVHANMRCTFRCTSEDRIEHRTNDLHDDDCYPIDVTLYSSSIHVNTINLSYSFVSTMKAPV